MRRSLQVLVSLLTILLLAHPFDCFATARIPEAMNCCLKGQCAPTAKADSCCKNIVPGTNHFIASKAGAHLEPLSASSRLAVSVPRPATSVPSWLDPARHPPPPFRLAALNLPLLI
jgi:hypothetical protein